MTIIARNVIPNPAVMNDTNPVAVSLFCWSEENQLDINAKRCYPIPETNDWIYERIPINNTKLHSFFYKADDITIHLYASGDETSNVI